MRFGLLRFFPLLWLKLGVDGFRFDAVPHIWKNEFSDDRTRGVYLEKYKIDSEEIHGIFRAFRKILDEFKDRVGIAEVYAKPKDLRQYYGTPEDRKARFSPENFIMQPYEGCLLYTSPSPRD